MSVSLISSHERVTLYIYMYIYSSHCKTKNNNAVFHSKQPESLTEFLRRISLSLNSHSHLELVTEILKFRKACLHFSKFS